MACLAFSRLYYFPRRFQFSRKWFRYLLLIAGPCSLLSTIPAAVPLLNAYICDVPTTTSLIP